MTPIDVERARAETPGCRDLAFFNNAGSALRTDTVLSTHLDHLRLEATIGGYEAQAAEAERIEAVWHSIAALIGGDRDEVALTTSATAGLHLFLYSFALRLRPGDRILTTTTEYGANYVAYLQVAGRTGADIEVVPDDPTGALDVDALAAMIDGRVRLVTVNHVPTNGGLVNPAAEIGAVTRSRGVPFLLDAAQSAGQVAIDVDEIGCDALVTNGRKFLRGPRGVGFLWVRRTLLDTLEPHVLDHDTATWVAPDRYEIRPGAARFETWERDYAAVLGLGRAVDEAMSWGLDAIETRITDTADTLRHRLVEEVAGARVHDLGARRCGIVTFTVDGHDAIGLRDRLADAGVVVGVVPPASALLDTARRDLPPLVRASVHIYNDDTDLDRLIAALP